MNCKIAVSREINSITDFVNEELKKAGLGINHEDVYFLNDKEKLGVEQVKKIRQFLSIKPYRAKNKWVVLVSAGNLSLDAQNALLKTLEEPSEFAKIVLGVNREDELLPTVRSRCEVVRIERPGPGVEDRGFLGEIEKLERMSVEERFGVIEKIEEKEKFLVELTAHFRDRIRYGKKELEFAKALLKALEWREQNVNIRAILEYLMLKMP